MSYILNKSNGNVLGTINDNTIVNNLASISFVGRSTMRFGEVQQENILHMLENFASSSAPSYPILGQLWYDLTSSKLKICINESPVTWKNLNFINFGAVPPASPEDGELYFNTTVGALYAYNGATWTKIGPDDPSITKTVSTLTTNTGSPTATVNIPFDDNSSYLVNFKVVARDVTTKSNNASFIVNLNAYRANSSNVIIVGAENIETISKSAGVAENWEVEVSIDTTNLQLIVTGDSGANNIVWKVLTETFKNG